MAFVYRVFEIKLKRTKLFVYSEWLSQRPTYPEDFGPRGYFLKPHGYRSWSPEDSDGLKAPGSCGYYILFQANGVAKLCLSVCIEACLVIPTFITVVLNTFLKCSRMDMVSSYGIVSWIDRKGFCWKHPEPHPYLLAHS